MKRLRATIKNQSRAPKRNRILFLLLPRLLPRHPPLNVPPRRLNLLKLRAARHLRRQHPIAWRSQCRLRARLMLRAQGQIQTSRARILRQAEKASTRSAQLKAMRQTERPPRRRLLKRSETLYVKGAGARLRRQAKTVATIKSELPKRAPSPVAGSGGRTMCGSTLTTILR